MTDYDKSTIQRMFGVIEGVAMLLDKRYAEPILSAVGVIDETLKKKENAKMTASEAVEMLKECGLNIVQPQHDEVLNIVVEAVGKQIPKKPVGDLHSVPHYRCPTCKSAVVVFEKDTRYVFCKWCGQALDWSDTE